MNCHKKVGIYAKAIRRLALSVIAPAMVKRLQQENAAGVSRRRWHDDKYIFTHRMARPLHLYWQERKLNKQSCKAMWLVHFVGNDNCTTLPGRRGWEVGCSRYSGNLWPDWSEPNRLRCHMQEIKITCPSIRKRFANWLSSESVPSVHSTSRVERKYEGFDRQ